VRVRGEEGNRSRISSAPLQVSLPADHPLTILWSPDGLKPLLLRRALVSLGPFGSEGVPQHSSVQRLRGSPARQGQPSPLQLGISLLATQNNLVGGDGSLGIGWAGDSNTQPRLLRIKVLTPYINRRHRLLALSPIFFAWRGLSSTILHPPSSSSVFLYLPPLDDDVERRVVAVVLKGVPRTESPFPQELFTTTNLIQHPSIRSL
jgi:hypothetical protein